MREQMRADLVDAMTARDRPRTAVLRSTLAAVANAEAVEAVPVTSTVSEVPRKELTDDDVRAIVASELDHLLTTSAEMRELGQVEEADDLAAQAAILSDYLAR